MDAAWEKIAELLSAEDEPVTPPKKDCPHDQGEYGTGVSGYSPAADGAKKCETCVHESEGRCDHPMVLLDLDVNKLQESTAPVEADGCCTYWWPRKS